MTIRESLNNNDCEHPMRIVETRVMTYYCRICGYQKTITATKEHDNEEALNEEIHND